jgi:hypothetical protein
MQPTTVFALTSGRSGTHYLYELLRHNACDCVARHEPYGFNPSMFGRPIYDYAVGERSYTRKLLERKRWIIDRCGASTYVETNHAFLKSWFDLAPEYFPRLKLVHLVRDPLKVAKSEAYREEVLHRLHLPFRNYRGGDGRKYFRWALTGHEPIFQQFGKLKMTCFQRYVVQWIEIENRAMQFLEKFKQQATDFTLHSPVDLNDAARVAELFDFLALKRCQPELHLVGRRNRGWRPTVITDGDRRQFEEVIRAMPPTYLEIFRHEPYCRFPWASALQRPPGDAL